MSTVLIACPQCGKELKLRDRSLLGRRGKCPSCEHRFLLREPDEVELELAEPEPPAEPLPGTSPKWVPDAPAESAAAAPSAVTTAPSPAPEFPIPQIADDAGGLERLREIKRRNARRRRISIAAGGLMAVVIAGVGAYVWSNYTPAPSVTRPPPQVDAAYQATVEELKSNAVRADALSPTQGKPIQLLFVPTGARLVVNLRPAQLWSDQDQFKEFRYCLGPLAEWTAAQITEVCLFEPAQIEELLLALVYGTPGQPPYVCGVVHLAEEPKRSDLIEKFHGQPNRDFGYPVYVGSEHTYLISTDDSRTFAFVPNALNATQEMVDATAAPAATDLGIEEILRSTDRDRHITVVFRPDDARRHQDALFTSAAVPLMNQVLDWFNPDEIETVAWSLHLDEQRFHSQVLVRNKNVIPTPRLHRSLDARLDELPQRVLGAVEMMQPKEVGKRTVIGRFPAMVKALELATVNGITDRFVQLTTVLPERAAPNLALGTLLAWDESTRTDFDKAPAPAPSQDPKLPATIAERLKKPIEIDFRRTPLQEAFLYIGDETKVKFEIDGDALKLSGYTQNMPQTMNLGVVPATKGLHEIVKQYGEMVIVVDEKAKVATVMTKAVAERKGLKPFPLP